MKFLGKNGYMGYPLDGEWKNRKKNTKEFFRPRRDSNSQSSDPKSDALSIRPRGLQMLGGK